MSYDEVTAKAKPEVKHYAIKDGHDSGLQMNEVHLIVLLCGGAPRRHTTTCP
jgi:hypothetical protein